MICIICAILTDHWVQTTEPISSPFKEEQRSNVMNIDFDVGLWRVCPTVQWTPDTAEKAKEKPQIYCSDVGYKRLWNNVDWKELGLWGPVESTTTVISRMRLSTVFILFSAVIIVVSTFSVLLGHCFKGKKMLIASGLYAFGGLILGSGLFTFVCFLTDEFGIRNSNNIGSGESFSSSHGDLNRKGVHYKYGKSFIQAIFAFLSAEIAAVLSIHAFLNRFESEEEFIKMIPGMERRIREHSSTYFTNTTDTANVTISGSDHGDQLSKNGTSQPSFVHRPPNSKASEESLYGLQMPDPVSVVIASETSNHHHLQLHQQQQLPQIAESHILSDIAVCPPPPPARTLSTNVMISSAPLSSKMMDNGESDSDDHVSPPRKREKEDNHNESMIPSPPPKPIRSGNCMTLPRLDLYHHRLPSDRELQQIPIKTAQIKKGSRLSSYSSKEDGDGAESPRMSESALAMTTMPRNLNHNINNSKKKSVTIGTFTKVETFDFSSAI
uniref:Putative LOC100746146 [Bombus impatiens] n=1 Tax=Lepeophtheirus salmonis TaxID=72036 RepID=A0A0K2UM81_LEPSM